MSAAARTQIERDGHSASCRICGHTEYGETDLDALRKLGPHAQECLAKEGAHNVIPLKKKG